MRLESPWAEKYCCVDPRCFIVQLPLEDDRHLWNKSRSKLNKVSMLTLIWKWLVRNILIIMSEKNVLTPWLNDGTSVYWKLHIAHIAPFHLRLFIHKVTNNVSQTFNKSMHLHKHQPFIQRNMAFNLTITWSFFDWSYKGLRHKNAYLKPICGPARSQCLWSLFFSLVCLLWGKCTSINSRNTFFFFFLGVHFTIGKVSPKVWHYVQNVIHIL